MENQKNHAMFSLEHIQALVDLIGNDALFLEKAQASDLTTQVAIKLEATDKIYKFSLDKGKLAKLDFDENAPFVLSASKEIWEAVFFGKLNPIVGIMQGKIKLKGDLVKLIPWYGAFNRMFELFKEIKVSV